MVSLTMKTVDNICQRKYKKTFGIDGDLARKERELKNSKLQKVKRSIRANKHRKIAVVHCFLLTNVWVNFSDTACRMMWPREKS